MEISVFSVASAVVWFNVAILLVAFLRPKSAFLMRHGASVLLALFFLGVVRFLLPLDLEFSYIVESRYVLPAIQRFLRVELVAGYPYLTVGAALVWVWVTGCVVSLVRSVQRVRREKAYRDGFHASPSPQAARVLAGMGVRNASVSVVEELSVPIVFGVFRAHIYLPRMELSDAELELVLTHELRHVKSHDTLIKLFYLALCILFWWNPLVAIFRDDLDRLLELRCDAAVVRSLGKESKRAYLKSILAVMKQASASDIKQTRHMDARAFAGASGLFSDDSTAFLKQRFELALAEDARPTRERAISLSVIVAAFLLSFLVIVQPVSQPPAGEGGITINSENAYILVEDEVWTLYVDGNNWGSISSTARNILPYRNLTKYEG